MVDDIEELKQRVKTLEDRLDLHIKKEQDYTSKLLWIQTASWDELVYLHKTGKFPNDVNEHLWKT